MMTREERLCLISDLKMLKKEHEDEVEAYKKEIDKLEGEAESCEDEKIDTPYGAMTKKEIEDTVESNFKKISNIEYIIGMLVNDKELLIRQNGKLACVLNGYSEEEPSPCMFCKLTPELNYNRDICDITYWVECCNDDCLVSGPVRNNMSDAVCDWNKMNMKE